LSKVQSPNQEGTSEVKSNRVRPSLKVTTGGRGVVSHAGARLLCDLADVTGLTEALSRAMAPTKQRQRGHDRGQVLVDLAVMLADGGKTISDLATLRNQPALFGEVASTPTAWRTLEAVGPELLVAIARARAQARAVAWAAGADPGFYVMDFDGTLLTAHSDKEGAAPTYKRGFGFHPLVVFLDATGEALAGKLRPGNAASNTTADHVEVLEAALGQLPVDPHQVEVVARADSGALSHGFADACRERGVRFAIGYDLTETVRQAVLAVPGDRWEPAVSADGTNEREGAEVAEITDLLDLSSWPEGTRAITRREDPHPGAQLTFTDIDGHRFQVFITDLADPDVTYLEALHRGRGRAEQRIRDAKDTGLRNLPSESFAINAAWLTLVLVALDLMAWAGLLCLEAELARAEPKRLRYCLFHTAGVIVRSGRRIWLRLAAGWPWADQLAIAFARLRALPLRA
jgi:hypothetical protein